jgi:hypothetical protein
MAFYCSKEWDGGHKGACRTSGEFNPGDFVFLFDDAGIPHIPEEAFAVVIEQVDASCRVKDIGCGCQKLQESRIFPTNDVIEVPTEKLFREKKRNVPRKANRDEVMASCFSTRQQLSNTSSRGRPKYDYLWNLGRN